MAPELSDAIFKLSMSDAVVSAAIMTCHRQGLNETDTLAHVVLHLAARNAALVKAQEERLIFKAKDGWFALRERAPRKASTDFELPHENDAVNPPEGILHQATRDKFALYAAEALRAIEEQQAKRERRLAEEQRRDDDRRKP